MAEQESGVQPNTVDITIDDDGDDFLLSSLVSKKKRRTMRDAMKNASKKVVDDDGTSSQDNNSGHLLNSADVEKDAMENGSENAIIHDATSNQDKHSGQLSKGKDVEERGLPSENISKFSEFDASCKEWSVECNVISKNDVHYYKNAKGYGSVLNVLVADIEGTKMQLTMFNEDVKLFEPLLQVTKWCKIANGSIRKANAKYNVGDTMYEVLLHKNSDVESVESKALSIPVMKYNFIKLNELFALESEFLVDVVGILVKVGEEITFNKADGSKVMKRDIAIMDMSQDAPIQVTLWGKFSSMDVFLKDVTTFGQVILVASKLRIIKEYGGSLSTVHLSSVMVNPIITEVDQLRSWAMANQVAIQARQDVLLKVVKLKYERLTIDEILKIEPTMQNNTFECKLWIVSVSTRQDPWYIACLDCNAKLELINGSFICQSCKLPKETYKHSGRMRIKVADNTGSLWVTLFDVRVEKLLGLTMDSLRKLKEMNFAEFVRVIEKCVWKLYKFTIRKSLRLARNGEYNYSCEDFVEIGVDSAEYIPSSTIKGKY